MGVFLFPARMVAASAVAAAAGPGCWGQSAARLLSVRRPPCSERCSGKRVSPAPTSGKHALATWEPTELTAFRCDSCERAGAPVADPESSPVTGVVRERNIAWAGALQAVRRAHRGTARWAAGVGGWWALPGEGSESRDRSAKEKGGGGGASRVADCTARCLGLGRRPRPPRQVWGPALGPPLRSLCSRTRCCSRAVSRGGPSSFPRDPSSTSSCEGVTGLGGAGVRRPLRWQPGPACILGADSGEFASCPPSGPAAGRQLRPRLGKVRGAAAASTVRPWNSSPRWPQGALDARFWGFLLREAEGGPRGGGWGRVARGHVLGRGAQVDGPLLLRAQPLPSRGCSAWGPHRVSVFPTLVTGSEISTCVLSWTCQF